MHFITLHLGDKGNLGVQMNPEMSQGFGFSSVTQTWTSHWSWQSLLWHNGKSSKLCWWSLTHFSKGCFVSRLCGVIFNFAHSLIFKFYPDSPVLTPMDRILPKYTKCIWWFRFSALELKVEFLSEIMMKYFYFLIYGGYTSVFNLQSLTELHTHFCGFLEIILKLRDLF